MNINIQEITKNKFYSIIESILLYGSEMWTLAEERGVGEEWLNLII
jgi:hypothetical protein